LPRKLQETLHDWTGLAKDRKAFRIWLMQPNACNGDKVIEEEEDDDDEEEDEDISGLIT